MDSKPSNCHESIIGNFFQSTTNSRRQIYLLFCRIGFTGHEILDFVDQINLAVNRSRISLLNIKRALRKYEQRLSQILDQSGFTSTKQALVLQIQYFHLLVVIYDNLVSGVFNQSDEITPNYANEIPSSNERQFCLK